MGQHVKARYDTHIPPILQTAYDAGFKLMVIHPRRLLFL